MMVSLPAGATKVSFDQEAVGSLPGDWIGGVTDRGKPKWTIEADPTAPSAPNVLRQSGVGTFPWCIKKGTWSCPGFADRLALESQAVSGVAMGCSVAGNFPSA